MSLHSVDTGGDEDGCRDVACVSSSLTGLRADEVDTGLESLGDMLRVSNHLRDTESSSATLLEKRRIVWERTFMTGIPALCNFSTAHEGGMPTAQTKSEAFSSMITSMRSGS